MCLFQQIPIVLASVFFLFCLPVFLGVFKFFCLVYFFAFAFCFFFQIVSVLYFHKAESDVGPHRFNFVAKLLPTPPSYHSHSGQVSLPLSNLLFVLLSQMLTVRCMKGILQSGDSPSYASSRAVRVSDSEDVDDVTFIITLN